MRLVATSSERILLIAQVIERYVAEHPRAADTAKGIHTWWVAPHRRDDSLADVQQALDHLVALGRFSRTVLADGTAIYSRAADSN